MSLEGTGAHEFDLVDATGKSHHYIVTEHAAGEGTEIVFELMGMCGPTVLQLLGAALSSDGLLRAFLGAIGGAGFGADAGAEVLAALTDFDFGKAGGELQRAFGNGKAPLALVKKLVARARRDGDSVPAVFDRAYQANYFELAQLLARVIAINRFFPGLPTSGS